MSVAYLKQILTGSRDIVCLLGRAPAIAGGCDFYREDYAYEIETKYGRSPERFFRALFLSIVRRPFMNVTGKKS